MASRGLTKLHRLSHALVILVEVKDVKKVERSRKAKGGKYDTKSMLFEIIVGSNRILGIPTVVLLRKII